jgi:polar amino acid transport system permease protein
MRVTTPSTIEPASAPIRSAQGRMVGLMSGLPWWFLVLLLAGLLLAYQIATDELYSDILRRLVAGFGITILVTAVAYSTALVLGLLAGLGRVSSNPLLFNLSTLYVNVIRGVPILVQIFYVAFVLTPACFWAAPRHRSVGAGDGRARR